jgi:hypothetical protein
MARIIERLVEPIAGFSPIECHNLEFVSKKALCEIEVPKTIIATGKKAGYETAFFTRNAQQLAALAKQRGAAGGPVAAVLFRDTDGTRATERGLFEDKWRSIVRGFASAGFENGVPMVPKPKSEAWLLCALKSNPYQHCSGLEDSLSGNDNVPDSAKQQLDRQLGFSGRTVADLADMIRTGAIAPERIAMPSFDRFRGRLEEVTRRMLRQPLTTQQN